jgi:hypothetical protein
MHARVSLHLTLRNFHCIRRYLENHFPPYAELSAANLANLKYHVSSILDHVLFWGIYYACGAFT